MWPNNYVPGTYHSKCSCFMQEVHPHPAIGVAVDVIELSDQYLFVVEVRGLKNTNLKVSFKDKFLLIYCVKSECELKNNIPWKFRVL